MTWELIGYDVRPKEWFGIFPYIQTVLPWSFELGVGTNSKDPILTFRNFKLNWNP